MMKKRVFLAFDTSDQYMATLIRRVLEKWFGDAIEVTFSPEFTFGTPWRNELHSAMRSGDVLLGVCTPHSIKNPWLHFEAGAFFGRGAHVIPLVSGNLGRDSLPAPLNDFQAPRLDSEADMAKLARDLATYLELPQPMAAAESARSFIPLVDMGVPEETAQEVRNLLEVYNLKPSERTRQILAHSSSPFRLAIDDVIVLFVAPGWSGLQRNDLRCSIGDRRVFDPQVARVAHEHRMTREDRDRNGEKLALVRIDPLMTDREWLRLCFEEMRYFDCDGPRRALWVGDSPSDFAKESYLGKPIPEGIPTPLACVHGVLVTRDGYLVLGIRRKAAKSDFPENDDRLCVTFEEQMRPEDGDVHGTMIRGIKEEAGIAGIDAVCIQVVAIHYESSFSSVCPVAVARLECTAAELSQSVCLKAKDHEWDPVFVEDKSEVLRTLLGSETMSWGDLKATHFLDAFSPRPTYRWHGSSRFRLLAYLAMRDGIGRLLKDVA